MGIAMTKPTAHDTYLFGLDPIYSQCPLDFGDGHKWDVVAGTCFTCRKQIPGDMFRGMVARTDDNTFTLEATGVCNDCRTVSVFDYRLHKHRKVTGEKGGIIAVWGGDPSLWDRVLKVIGL